MKLGYGAGIAEGWRVVLKRLVRNKRSSECSGERRGLTEDEFRWKERRGLRSLEALQGEGRKVGERGFAMKSGISINNTHHMP